jgi:hypothetical protein
MPSLEYWPPLLAPMLVHADCWNTWCIALLGLVTVFGEVADFHAIVAWVTGRCKLLWWFDCHQLLLLCWISTVVLLLLLRAVARELWWRSTWFSRGWCVDHAVIQGNTTRTASGGSGHGPLPLLLFSHFTGLHGALLVSGGTC